MLFRSVLRSAAKMVEMLLCEDAQILPVCFQGGICSVYVVMPRRVHEAGSRVEQCMGESCFVFLVPCVEVVGIPVHVGRVGVD